LPNCSHARGRTRAAIEDEGHRPVTPVRAVKLVGGIGDIGLRLALVVEQADRPAVAVKGEPQADIAYTAYQLDGADGAVTGR